MNSIYGIPPLSTTIEVTVPLTPKLALFVNNAGIDGYFDIGHNFVREINNRTIIGNGNYLITPTKIDKKFLDLCVRRFRQSLLLHLLSDDLNEKWDERMKKKRAGKKRGGSKKSSKTYPQQLCDTIRLCQKR